MRLKEAFENDVAIWRKHENASVAPTTTRFCYVAVKGNKYRFEQVERIARPMARPQPIPS